LSTYAVAGAVAEPRDFTVVCAGNNGVLSMEDTVCAGMLIAVTDEAFDASLADAACAARLTKPRAGVLKIVKSSDHGRYLQGVSW
jgi:phosphosulfolactate phosphohydrolase-like enzyme